MHRHSFRAMGTEVELFLVGEGVGALEAAEHEFHRLEALLSRFLPDSELSQLNRRGRLEASDDLLEVVTLALAARRRTSGRFDPTVHDALVAAGYDRSFEALAAEGPSLSQFDGRCGGGVTISDRTIELELGVHLDLGGIGKGYAVDRATAILAREGPALVNAGGDIAAHSQPDALGWRVGVESLTLSLDGGAVATSGRDRRRWRRDGEERHHLIDPLTGRPAETDLLRVTVIGRSALEAEVDAKALFLAGERAAVAEADALGLPSVLVTADGRTVLAGGLA
jgi:thiamine biosynthesis lipoprotein